MKDYLIDYDYYRKKSDSIDVGIDFLRLCFDKEFNIENYLLDLDYYSSVASDLVNVAVSENENDIDFFWLDDDNSNFCTISICSEIITASLISVRGTWNAICFTCDYNGVSVPLFLYRYFREKHIIDFYGSCFRLIAIDYLDNNFIKSVLDYFNIDGDYCDITRLDYRLDFFMNKSCAIPSPYTFLDYSISSSDIRQWHKWHTLTNWQVWNKDSRSLVVRLYDKLLDTRKKHKDFLYVDYFRYENVHRLEFECDIRFCKWYNFSNLDNLVRKVRSVFKLDNEKRLQPIFYRYNKNKLIYTRKELDRYMPYIKKAIHRLNFNYISSKLDEELNPLNVVVDYLWEINGTNDILSFETLSNASTYLNSRIKYHWHKGINKLKA